jgi:hypothetical protein
MPMPRTTFRFPGLVNARSVEGSSFNFKAQREEDTEIKTVKERKTTKQNLGNH